MPMETMFDYLIGEIGKALQGPKKENTTLKDLFSKMNPQEIEQAKQGATGGKDYLPKDTFTPRTSMEGADFSKSNPRNSFSTGAPPKYEMPLRTEMGSQYAPTNPYGATPPGQQEDMRTRYEQKSYGLDGLRESFMNEGMSPKIDTGLQSQEGLNINALNMALLQEEMRKKNSRPPGNMGWR